MRGEKRQVLAAVMALVAAFALIFGAGSAAAKKLKDPRKMTFPPLGEIRAPEIERHVLGSGMVVYLLEDHEFPLVDYQVLIRTGALYEPERLRGLAGITGSVLRTGGSSSVPGDELDERLESWGAYIESRIDDAQGSVSASFLSEQAEEGLELLADLIRHPAFPEEKIELAKVNARTRISSRNDEFIAIAFREFRKLMYGEHSPYGWHSEYETVEAITREDIAGFHRDYFHPDRMILVASGDLDAAKMLGTIERIFGGWPRSDRTLPPDPPVRGKAPKGIFYAEKGNVTQSAVLFGLTGTLASDPDYAALQLLNQILGSGFSSRMVNNIRTKRGLAYAVGSSPGTGWHHPGVWASYLLCQEDSTLVGAGLVRQEVERIVQEPVTETELKRAKDIVLNELVFDFASKQSVLRRKAFYEFYGYPPDFLEQYQENVRTLTVQDLLDAARRHIHPEEMAVVIVGTKEDFDGPLESLGPVTEIDITIPEPPSKLEIPEPTAKALEEGRGILRTAKGAHGGEKLGRVKTIRQEGKGSMSMMGQQMNFSLSTLRVLPDRTWAEINLGMFTIIQVSDGDGGWAQTPQGVIDLGPEEIEQAKSERIRLPIRFLSHWEEMTWQALKPQEFDGVLCDVVHAPEATVKEWVLYFDAATHLLRGMEYRGRGRGGPVHATDYLSDYRTVDGVSIPFAFRLLHDGEPFMEVDLSVVETNVPPQEALFQRPE